MTDNHGATSTSTLTVTINGANDAPVASNDVDVAQEAGTFVSSTWATGNVLANDSDVDNGHVLQVASLASGTLDTVWNYGSYGWLWLYSDGSYYYAPDDNNAVVDALGPGQTLVDTFTYTVEDEHGATGTATLSVTINGANDEPTGSVAITGAAYEGQTLTAVPVLSDPEGIVTSYSYQWQADGVNIGANSSTYVLAASDLGKTISVIVSYTDGGGTYESVTGSIVSHPGVIETGSIGADHIVGSSGDDSINGGAGKDRMEGLGGNDTYMVDNARDIVTEQAGGGIDSVIASCNYLLLDNVENLTLTGTGNFYAKGNASDNDLIGNSGKNAIYGFGGQDTLTGGAGADTFWMSAADVNSGKVVTITDFSVAQGDKINLSAIDAREGKSGNQPFTWIGTDSFASHGSNWTGLLRFDEGSHMLIGSTNADGTHLVEIQLIGIDHLGTDTGGLYIKNIVL
jgi:VCBS repeat-containing protein